MSHFLLASIQILTHVATNTGTPLLSVRGVQETRATSCFPLLLTYKLVCPLTAAAVFPYLGTAFYTRSDGVMITTVTEQNAPYGIKLHAFACELPDWASVN